MDSREILIEIRKETGMSRTEFAAYFKIPYRTVQEWELGNRKISDYLLRLMRYKLEMEKLIEKQRNEEDEGGSAYDE